MISLSFRALMMTLALVLSLPVRAQLTNEALGKPVEASGPVYDTPYGPEMITDGSASTFSHPAQLASPANFKYTVNLGRVQPLNKLRFLNRSGCCPERLTNYRVSVFAADPSIMGTAAVWTTVVRANGTNSGDGGVDEVVAGAHPTGVFAGQWLRIENLSARTYHPQLAEYEALSSPNVALYKRVTASAAVQADTTAASLTDGNPTTFSAPSGGAGATTGFTWEVDLAGDFGLDRLVLYSRQDCCPERLTRYRVEIRADTAGVPAAVRWAGEFRTDGSFPSAGAGEVIRAEQGAGEFRGRFVRVINLGGEAASPQLAEIEAYRATPPVIRQFSTSVGNITKTGHPARPASALLSWDVAGAASVTITPAPGAVTGPTGTTVVAPSDATTYTLSATNTAGTVSASLLIAVDAAEAPPRLNEILADNASGLADEDDSRQDWIEIYNPNPFTLPMAGAHLSDSPTTPTRWTFPLGTAIPPHGYLVVFASGKNRTEPNSPLHTNFSLQKSGEVISLLAPDAVTLWSRFPANYPTTATYPAQMRDTSYGLNGAGAERFFQPPTPGAANAVDGFSTVVAATSFLPERGFYSTPQSVTLSNTTPGATIRYTTNGTRPTPTTGTVYTGPISLTTTTVLRAAAFLEGAATPGIETHTYIFPATVQLQSTMRTNVTNNAVMGPQIPAALMDLPSISLALPSAASVNQDTEVETTMEWMNPTAPAQHTMAAAGITHFGGAYTDFNKKSFRLTFRAEYGDSRLSAPLFEGHAHGQRPESRFDSLELRNGSHDMAMRGFYMSNLFTDQVLAEMGHLAPHGRMVHLYLNGTYWGMYHLRERWNAAMHADYLGGTKDDYEAINGNLNVGGWADPATPFDGDGRAWEFLKTLRNDYAALRSRVDVTNLTDFMIAFMFGNSEDEWRSVSPNFTVGPGSGARFIINDADGWLSVTSNNTIGAWDGSDNNTARSASYNSNTNTFNPGRSMGDGPASLFSALYLAGGPEYRILLADRIHTHLFGNGALTPAQNDARLRALCSPIERAFIPESARWSYDASQNRSWASWKSARDVCLNQWIPNRTRIVLGQCRTAGLYPTLSAPVFSQNGGLVAVGHVLTLSIPSAPAGATIRYTLDGTDPRLTGGAIAPTAQLYSNGLPLTTNTIVRARSLNGTTWSALQEAFFQLDTSRPVPVGSIVPSEIHFHPAGDGDAEFIELANISTSAVNLRGCRFTSGVDFTFSEYRDTLLAPGQRLVLVDSEFAHRQRYGWDRPLAGIYAGNLNNLGETLTLTCGADVVFTAPFEDNWQLSTNGGGASLTLIHPSPDLNLADPTNWRPSTTIDGTPGAADAGPAFSGNPNADTDNDGITTFAEYALGSSDSIPDDSGGTKIIAQPDGTVLFSFIRAPAADDAIVTPEVSINLSAWHSDESWLIPHSQERLPDGRLLTRYSAGSTLLASGPHVFFHLKITARP
jgi:hypothetical protein